MQLPDDDVLMCVTPQSLLFLFLPTILLLFAVSDVSVWGERPPSSSRTMLTKRREREIGVDDEEGVDAPERGDW